MSNFAAFKAAVQRQFGRMTTDNSLLFIADVSGSDMWDMYLDSFPAGTNEIYKERREFDCQCCKSFIKRMGNVVAIDDNNQMISIWDGEVEAPFDVVSKAMSRWVKSAPVRDAFYSWEHKVGTDVNHAYNEDTGGTMTWEHFYLEVPHAFFMGKDLIDSKKGRIRDQRNVFKRSLDELTWNSAEIVLELIDQGSLYRGDEFRVAVAAFLELSHKYEDVLDSQKDLWCWKQSRSNPMGGIRNTAIGTLLINISEGLELDVAVGKFEAVVAPTNYKRPKAIFTQAMLKEAEGTITEMGYLSSLGRRHAKMDDITVNDVLFLNRHVAKTPSNVFEEMATEVAVNPKQLDKVEEVSVADFIEKILPKAESIQLMMENKHQGNLVTLIAPQDAEAPTMFKWGNNFSWTYAGDVADSMKQRVKAAGGKVDGVLRFSLQWNDTGTNQSDFDAHCVEPQGNLISYQSKVNRRTGGTLDVDIQNPRGEIAVENITWADLTKMDEGPYKFLVHNYSHRGDATGFTAEIEYEGQLYSYTHDKELKQDEKVVVAEMTLSKTDGIKFTKSLDSTYTQKELWGIKTNSFVDVSSVMRSPNYWDGANGSGNSHLMFFLNGCVNSNNPRGFYNEFLQEPLLEHKRVFEALGSKMRVEYALDQMSGLGFSTTQRGSVVAKIEGSFARTIKINF
jgi:hypothetical protein